MVSNHWAARIGVRAYLFLALVTTAVAPIGLFAWNRAEHLASVAIESSDRQTVATARATFQQVQLAVQGYIRAAEAVSGQVADMPLLDLEPLEQALRNHLEHHPEFLGAYVADAQGISIASVRADGAVYQKLIDYSDRDYYQELIRTRATTISRAAIGRISRVLTVQLVTPIVERGGKFLGFTCSSLELSTITDTARRTVDSLAGGRVLILDNHGTVIGDSSDSSLPGSSIELSTAIYADRIQGGAEVLVGEDEQHVLVRSAVLSLPEPLRGWRAIVTIPQFQVYEQAQRMRWAALRFGLAFCAMAVLISAWLATIIARPLRSLAEAARTAGAGDRNVRFQVPRNVPRELQHLGIALRQMTSALGRHAEHLEGLVAERTSELRLKNSDLVQTMELLHENERRLRSDIEQAKRFQQALLPKAPACEGFDVATHFAPLEQVSGDIFDVCVMEPGNLRIFLVDATGHGVQASMRTILLKSLYDRLKHQCPTPDGLLATLNSALLAESIGSDLCCTASCIDLRHTEDGADVTVACAGGPAQYLLSPGVPAQELFVEGPLLGVAEVVMPEPSRVRLTPGQSLLVTSDGLLEQWSRQRERFENELILHRAAEGESAQATLCAIIQRFEAFHAGVEVSDDVASILVRVL